MSGARSAIGKGRFEAFCQTTAEGWARGDIPPL